MAADIYCIAGHPNELIERIIEYVPVIDRVALGRVSKHMNEITQSVNHRVKSLLIASRSNAYYCHPRSVSFCGIKDHKFGKDCITTDNCDFLPHIVKALPNLKALAVGHFDVGFSKQELLGILHANSNLEHIDMNIDIGDDQLSTLNEISKHHLASRVVCLADLHFESYAKVNKLKELRNLRNFKFVFLSDGHKFWDALLDLDITGMFGRSTRGDDREFLNKVLESGEKLEKLGMRFDHRQVQQIVSGKLPKLKQIVATGSVEQFCAILKRQAIEEVDWKFVAIDNIVKLRNAFVASGHKLIKLTIAVKQVAETINDEVFMILAANCGNLVEFKFQGERIAMDTLMDLPEHLLPRLEHWDTDSIANAEQVHELFARRPGLRTFVHHRVENSRFKAERRLNEITFTGPY